MEIDRRDIIQNNTLPFSFERQLPGILKAAGFSLTNSEAKAIKSWDEELKKAAPPLTDWSEYRKQKARAYHAGEDVGQLVSQNEREQAHAARRSFFDEKKAVLFRENIPMLDSINERAAMAAQKIADECERAELSNYEKYKFPPKTSDMVRCLKSAPAIIRTRWKNTKGNIYGFWTPSQCLPGIFEE